MPTSIIKNIIEFSGLFSMLSCLTIFPFVFNNFIIPEIENKVEKKLEYILPIYAKGPKWAAHHLEVSLYIILKYLLLKIFHKPSETINLGEKFALQRVNYRVETASKFEVFMSFLDWVSNIWLLIASSLVCLHVF